MTADCRLPGHVRVSNNGEPERCSTCAKIARSASPAGSSVPGDTEKGGRSEVTAEVIAAIRAGGTTAIVCYTKCWACNFNQHPGGVHDWADQDDIEHAATTGQPSPVGQVCGCYCAAGPALPPEADEPDWDEVPYRNEPCVTCGEVGACGYDTEGRALIHVTEEGKADD